MLEFGTYDKIILWGLLFLKIYGSIFSVGVVGHFKDTLAPTVEKWFTVFEIWTIVAKCIMWPLKIFRMMNVRLL